MKTLWEKEKMLVTSIFPLSHNVFYPSQTKFHFFIYIYFVVCKCFQSVFVFQQCSCTPPSFLSLFLSLPPSLPHPSLAPLSPPPPTKGTGSKPTISIINIWNYSHYTIGTDSIFITFITQNSFKPVNIENVCR